MCIRDRVGRLTKARNLSRKQRNVSVKHVLIQEQMQKQKHTTSELSLLRSDLGELRGQLYNHTIRISDGEKSMSSKISVVEESMLNKISNV